MLLLLSRSPEPPEVLRFPLYATSPKRIADMNPGFGAYYNASRSGHTFPGFRAPYVTVGDENGVELYRGRDVYVLTTMSFFLGRLILSTDFETLAELDAAVAAARRRVEESGCTLARMQGNQPFAKQCRPDATCCAPSAPREESFPWYTCPASSPGFESVDHVDVNLGYYCDERGAHLIFEVGYQLPHAFEVDDSAPSGVAKTGEFDRFVETMGRETELLMHQR